MRSARVRRGSAGLGRRRKAPQAAAAREPRLAPSPPTRRTPPRRGPRPRTQPGCQPRRRPLRTSGRESRPAPRSRMPYRGSRRAGPRGLDRQPSERAGPGRRARESLKEACETEAPGLVRNAKPKLAAPSSASPKTTVHFGPTYRVAIPPGRPPTSAPAPNAATSRPAPVFVRSNSSAYPGTSGVSAPNSRASTKMIELTRTSRRRMPRA